MTTIEPAFRPAVLRTHEITFISDLSRDGGKVIQLGVMADITVRGLYGLGLSARESLTSEEAECVGKLIKDQLKAPFKYLSEVFERVFSAPNSAEAFAQLPAVYAHSLRFKPLAAREIEVPRPVIAKIDARRLWLEDELTGQSNRAFWKLFGEDVPPELDKSVREQAREQAA